MRCLGSLALHEDSIFRIATTSSLQKLLYTLHAINRYEKIMRIIPTIRAAASPAIADVRSRNFSNMAARERAGAARGDKFSRALAHVVIYSRSRGTGVQKHIKR
jgi:hypothetical protein